MRFRYCVTVSMPRCLVPPKLLFLLIVLVYSFRRCLHHEALLARLAAVTDHSVPVVGCLRPGSIGALG